MRNLQRDLYRFVVVSPHPLARAARHLYRRGERFSLPAPALVVKPTAALVQGLRSAYHAGLRIAICEPVMKGHCTGYGRNVHTGSSLHWIQGKGRIILGDDVLLDGKSAFIFSSAFTDDPTLRIGDRTVVGDHTNIVVGRSVIIGRDCLIARGVAIFDSPGHPSDPEARRSRLRPLPEDVRPVVIADNVWIGRDAVVGPGVTVGEGSIVTAKSVVLTNVPPYSVVMGNPARRVLQLERKVPAAHDPSGDEPLTA